MKTILLIGRLEETELQAIRQALGERYALLQFPDAASGAEALKERGDIAGVLLDSPSRSMGARELIDGVTQGNHYQLSLPVLLLTDRAHAAEDADFLGGAAVDCVEKPVIPVILKNRLDQCIAQINSASFSEFADMLKALPASIYLKDTQARYVFSSQLWHHMEIADDPDWTVRGKTDLELRKDRENGRRAYESDLKVIRSGQGVSYLIEEHSDGVREFLRIVKEPLKTKDGRVRGVIGLVSDVTEQELMRRELKRQSVTDTMTGLYNRSYYSEYLKTMDINAMCPLSILTMDCDGLKRVNDTCGHLAGDQYIRISAMVLHSCLPETACVFRMGGDEFVAFLPGVTCEQAKAYAETVLTEAAKYSVDGNQVSVSLGWSTMSSPDESVLYHVRNSDNEMYRNKQNKKAARA